MKKVILLVALVCAANFSFATGITGSTHYLCQGTTLALTAPTDSHGTIIGSWISTSPTMAYVDGTGLVHAGSAAIANGATSVVIGSTTIKYVTAHGPDFIYTVFLVFNGNVTITPGTGYTSTIAPCATNVFTVTPAVGRWSSTTGNLSITGNSLTANVRARTTGAPGASPATEPLTYTYDTYTCGIHTSPSATVTIAPFPNIRLFPSMHSSVNLSTIHSDTIQTDNYVNGSFWSNTHPDLFTFTGNTHAASIIVKSSNIHATNSAAIYYYYIPVSTNPGCGYIYPLTLTCTGHKGTNDEQDNTLLLNENTMQYKSYPNPSNGIFKINLPNTTEGKNIIITDISGRVVQTKNTTEPTADFNLSLLPKGTYLVNVYAGEEKHQEIVVLE
jgi:hypothetical protein